MVVGVVVFVGVLCVICYAFVSFLSSFNLYL